MRNITKFLMLVVLCLVGMQGNAQNVTISPQNGSMICSDASGSGTSGGAFSMWRHEQLALVMIASGSTALTEEGILKNHRNWFNTCNGCTFSPTVSNTDKAKFIDCGWQDANGYYTISLPKGYRFTGYTIDLSHDISNTGQGFTTTSNTTVSFAETGSDFGTAINSVSLPALSNTSPVTIETLTRTGDDMGNVLYFKATTPNDASGTQFYDLTFRYVELTFTADADTRVDIMPSTTAISTSTGHSMLEVPFNTGKVDLGEVTQRAIPNYGERISYSLTNFSDMSASMLLYESDSYKSATAEESYDGTPGYVAYNKETGGSITTVGDYFKLDPGSSEKIYFLESPTYATMENGESNPIQFRIVGADIEFNNGSSITKTCDEFTVVGSRTTGSGYNQTTTTYYADANFKPADNSSNAEKWYLDENGHITNGTSYLAVTDRGYGGQATYATTTTNSADAVVCEITSQGFIVRKSATNAPLTVNSASWFRFQANVGNQVRIDKTGKQVVKSLSPGTGECTIKVYDKTGENLLADGTVTVNDSHKTGTIPLIGFNNDAIKFSVQGTGYVKFNVILQALNPYIDQMTVVMNDTDNGKDLRMTRTFTADDFSVGGGTFTFYLPEDCDDDDLFITFEDLYSKYGDDTYDHTDKIGQSDSRYNFVMSQHHQAFPDDNIYKNKAEAANDTKESVRLAVTNAQGDVVGQNVRTKVGTVGNVAFRFNNADELSTNEGYMTEYPFTVANYQNQTNPGRGSFITAFFDSDDTSTDEITTKTFYVFTTDETKYNIAPTTATQHRFYAFYTMIVEIVMDEYTPTVTFKPLYDKTCYVNGDEEAYDAFYGVKVTVPGITDPVASDMATYKAILTNLDTTGEDGPKDAKQILYLDMSELKGVYHSPVINENDADYAVSDFNDLRSKLATNALVFLPVNSTERYNNFAYAKKGESGNVFQAANNIVLTDKQPFFSPYDIQVDAANYAKYTRNLTYDTYDEDKLATVILPYALTISGGKHVNPAVASESIAEDKNSFYVMKMTSATLSDPGVPQGHDYYYGKSFFTNVSGNTTEANTPYMVKVDEATTVEGDNISFLAIEKGALVKATTGMKKRTGTGEDSKSYTYDYLYTGETVTSSFDIPTTNTSVTLTSEGSYSGQKYDRVNSEKIFYFANNKFLNLYILNATKQYLYAYPFHAVYSFDGNFSDSAIASVLGLEISFEDPGNLDYIRDVTKSFTPDLAVRSGKGYIQMTSDKNQTVDIRSLNGTSYSKVNINAGDSQTVTLPAGVYLVNNVKIIVK